MENRMAPGLLVASPTLRCPFFHHTVVLMIEHGENGSFGLVVNRPMDLTFASILDAMGVEIAVDEPSHVPVMLGGPVSPESGFVLCETETSRDLPHDSVRVGERIAMSTSTQFLVSIARGEGPPRRTLVLGYSGWGPGQLEQEMRDGSWMPVDLANELVFEAPIDDRWRLALERLGVNPARVVGRHVASA